MRASEQRRHNDQQLRARLAAADEVGCTALHLGAFGFTRWAMFRLVSWTGLSAAAVVLLLLPVGPHVPALGSIAALMLCLVALNSIELWRGNKHTSLVHAVWWTTR